MRQRASIIMKSLFIYIAIYSILFSHISMASQPMTDYLSKPTGKYGVAFKDLHFVNTNLCPDPYYSKRSKNDYSSDNNKHCHELMIRIYYPTTSKISKDTLYYRPIVETEQKSLRAIPTIKLDDIKKLSALKSHTIEDAPIVKDSKFPVLLFISGLGGQAQLYENIITQLVSNGYIVVGINSIHINGDITLPNKRVVSTIDVVDWRTVDKTTIPVLEQDISFIYHKIHDPSQDAVFKSMDLKHIGALGHSFGGRAIANVANQHEKWFQALVTFDMEVHMGSFKPISHEMPFMHIISAYFRSANNWQRLYYQLNKNSYLVTLSPSADDKHYSYHMNFTDLSTLQYMSAYQALMAYNHSKSGIGEDVIVKNHGKNIGKSGNTDRPVYLIVKNESAWNILYYESGVKTREISLDMIPGLQTALDNLPRTELSERDLIPIKELIHNYHRGYGNFLGNGSGFKITSALNQYVLRFFNAYLKNESNPFKKCIPLTSNTYMECGPGIF